MFQKNLKLATSLFVVLVALAAGGCNQFESLASSDADTAQEGTDADTADTQSGDTDVNAVDAGTDASQDLGNQDTAAEEVKQDTDAGTQDLGNQDTQQADASQEVTKVVAECDKAADCSDNNPCTTDYCDAGKCQHAAAAGNCDDGNACTDNDTCVAGACKGAEKDCADNNPCTDDFCLAGSCVYGVNTDACDDGNACTQNDKCQGGACQGGKALVCDDNNPCTTDSCDPDNGCVNDPVVCDDNNPCTTDSCDSKTGDCLNAQKDCDDGKAYTYDFCDYDGWYGEPGQCISNQKWNGCQKDSDCADGNACTDNVCDSFSGTCKTVYKNCNDNNPCTVDACVPAKGCVNTEVACDDGNAKTTDSCDSATGACTHTPIAQPPTNPPPSGSGTVNVSVACGGVACEGHLYFGQQLTGDAFDNFGTAQANSSFVVDLPKSQLCAWGMEVAARMTSATWPWYGCDAGAPSLNTVTVKINGVVMSGVLTKHPWTCGGGGEGNLAFSKAQLGCP